MIKRFFKFASVRVFGAGLSLFLLYLAVDILKIDKYIAQLILIVISFFAKFSLNNLVTWADRKARSNKEILRRIILYALTGLLVGGVNFLIYYCLVEASVHYLISALISGVITSVIGFAICDIYVWKAK